MPDGVRVGVPRWRGNTHQMWLLAIIWSLMVAVSLAWNIHQERRQTRTLAEHEARAHFDKDQAFRHWGSRHGGVYVTPDERTPPNPHLAHIPDRDLVTESGRRLTLMNPAYMVRQMMSEFDELYGVKGRITSLKVLNPDNAPDRWERAALLAFEAGWSGEVAAYTELGGTPHLRLIRPMMTEEGCLKCHGHQGYAVGDVRGGVGVSVPLGPYLELERAALRDALLGHGGVWLLGLAGIGALGRRERQRRAVEKSYTARLADQEARLREAQRIAGVGHWNLDLATGALSWSEESRRIFGLEAGVAELEYQDFLARVHPEDREAVRRAYEESVAGHRGYEIEHRVVLPQGEVRWVREHCRTFYAADGSPLRSAGTVQDITAQRLVREREQLAASVFTHAREGIVITDAAGTIVAVNEAFSRITGYDRDTVVGRNPRLLKSGHQGPEFYADLWQALVERGHWSGEIWNRRRDGEVYAEILTISAVRDDEGATRHYVGLFSDITALKEHQRELEYIAHYDTLTGLPNRVLLADRLRQAMAQTLRRGDRLAVVFLDLDGFKAINDGHGHAAGDALLATVATRMRHALREGDTVARLGGDEFVAVLAELGAADDTQSMVARLQAAVAEPVLANGHTLQVSASLGIASYPQAEEVDPDQLIRQADQAMCQAKQAGKNRYHLFDADHDRHVRGRHETIERIRRALHGGELVLHYQPKVNMRNGTVVGAEALLRWQHPRRGLLPPSEVLPEVEDHPLVIELGDWTIDAALSQVAAWRERGLELPVSVNVSARQLQQADFLERLRALLRAHPGVPADHLQLEVLETSALDDLHHASEVMRVCGELGVGFALDDFGTGYSSLTYLKHLPAGQLKIDRTFVMDMLHDAEDLAILEGVMGLAAAFRREVIAEGVETMEHARVLLRLGCDLGQGFAIAAPMPAREVPGWVAGWRPDPSWAGQCPIGRAVLPLLFADVEHNAWVRAVEAHLRGGRDALPPMATGHCRFGQWLADGGRQGWGSHPAFATVEAMHEEVHRLAGQLVQAKAGGADAAGLAAGLAELGRLRDSLRLNLDLLMREERRGGDIPPPAARENGAGKV